MTNVGNLITSKSGKKTVNFKILATVDFLSKPQKDKKIIIQKINNIFSQFGITFSVDGIDLVVTIDKNYIKKNKIIRDLIINELNEIRKESELLISYEDLLQRFINLNDQIYQLNLEADEHPRFKISTRPSLQLSPISAFFYAGGDITILKDFLARFEQQKGSAVLTRNIKYGFAELYALLKGLSNEEKINKLKMLNDLLEPLEVIIVINNKGNPRMIAFNRSEGRLKTARLIEFIGRVQERYSGELYAQNRNVMIYNEILKFMENLRNIHQTQIIEGDENAIEIRRKRIEIEQGHQKQPEQEQEQEQEPTREPIRELTEQELLAEIDDWESEVDVEFDVNREVMDSADVIEAMRVETTRLENQFLREEEIKKQKEEENKKKLERELESLGPQNIRDRALRLREQIENIRNRDIQTPEEIIEEEIQEVRQELGGSLLDEELEIQPSYRVDDEGNIIFYPVDEDPDSFINIVNAPLRPGSPSLRLPGFIEEGPTATRNNLIDVAEEVEDEVDKYDDIIGDGAVNDIMLTNAVRNVLFDDNVTRDFRERLEGNENIEENDLTVVNPRQLLDDIINLNEIQTAEIMQGVTNLQQLIERRIDIIVNETLNNALQTGRVVNEGLSGGPSPDFPIFENSPDDINSNRNELFNEMDDVINNVSMSKQKLNESKKKLLDIENGVEDPKYKDFELKSERFEEQMKDYMESLNEYKETINNLENGVENIQNTLKKMNLSNTREYSEFSNIIKGTKNLISSAESAEGLTMSSIINAINMSRIIIGDYIQNASYFSKLASRIVNLIKLSKIADFYPGNRVILRSIAVPFKSASKLTFNYMNLLKISSIPLLGASVYYGYESIWKGINAIFFISSKAYRGIYSYGVNIYSSQKKPKVESVEYSKIKPSPRSSYQQQSTPYKTPSISPSTSQKESPSVVISSSPLEDGTEEGVEYDPKMDPDYDNIFNNCKNIAQKYGSYSVELYDYLISILKKKGVMFYSSIVLGLVSLGFLTTDAGNYYLKLAKQHIKEGIKYAKETVHDVYKGTRNSLLLIALIAGGLAIYKYSN